MKLVTLLGFSNNYWTCKKTYGCKVISQKIFFIFFRLLTQNVGLLYVGNFDRPFAQIKVRSISWGGRGYLNYFTSVWFKSWFRELQVISTASGKIMENSATVVIPYSGFAPSYICVLNLSKKFRFSYHPLINLDSGLIIRRKIFFLGYLVSDISKQSHFWNSVIL